MFDIRDRFEDLLEAHPAVTIVDGDREWTTARFDVPDPDALRRRTLGSRPGVARALIYSSDSAMRIAASRPSEVSMR